MGNESSAPYRFLRIHEVLSDAAAHGQKLSLQDLDRLQSDVVTLPAREVQPLLAHSVGGSPDPAARLRLSWNCSVDRDSSAAAPFEIWIQEVQRFLYRLLVPQSAWGVMWCCPSSCATLRLMTRQP
ncbi:MAG: penicillin acylase family protein [Terriglobia bacterium]